MVHVRTMKYNPATALEYTYSTSHKTCFILFLVFSNKYRGWSLQPDFTLQWILHPNRENDGCDCYSLHRSVSVLTTTFVLTANTDIYITSEGASGLLAMSRSIQPVSSVTLERTLWRRRSELEFSIGLKTLNSCRGVYTRQRVLTSVCATCSNALQQHFCVSAACQSKVIQVRRNTFHLMLHWFHDLYTLH